MATMRSSSWDILCPICKNFIEPYNDDLQSSLDYHYFKMHPTVKKSPHSNNQQLKSQKYTNKFQYREKCTKYIICPICDDIVEFLKDNVSRCLQEHFENCHQHAYNETSNQNASKFQSGNFSGKFRGHKSWKEKSGTFHGVDGGLENQKNQSAGLYDLPKNLKKHQGFIVVNSDRFVCQMCSVSLETSKNVQDHLKTKIHEDNVIMFLKYRLPNHLHEVMEFVSFYGSNLSCNLCSCKIELNSNNPHETLLNIISHNADVTHTRNKFHGDTRNQNDVGCSILKAVSDRNPLINGNKHLIETEMEPHFRCTLCDKNITYSKSDQELEKSFLSHINSSLHNKNIKAMNVLQSFREINGDGSGKHKLFVLNGNINCSQCKCTIEANIEELMAHSHCNRNAETRQFTPKKSESFTPVYYSKPQGSKHPSPSPYRNKNTSGMTRWTSCDSVLNKGQIIHSKANNAKEIKKLNVREILQPLQNQLGNIACIAENEQESLTCLICNCSVPPTTHNVKMHITGKFHKNKIQCQIKELNNLNIEEAHEERHKDLVGKIFQSLPQRFQEERANFKNCPIDGYITCSLCGHIINPHFLEMHIQEETHLQKKQELNQDNKINNFNYFNSKFC